MEPRLKELRDDHATKSLWRQWPVDSYGQVCTKRAVVETIEKIVTLMGLPIKDTDENNLYGGHTLRVSAAQHLARIGIALPIIMLLARWESQAIMGYVAEAPLATVTRDYKQKEAQDPLTHRISSLDQHISGNVEITATSDNSELANLEEKFARMESRLQKMEKIKLPYVKNDISDVTHLIVFCDEASDPSEWQTKCGWRFYLGQHSRKEALPIRPSLICGTCLPLEKMACKETASASVSSESSTSDSAKES